MHSRKVKDAALYMAAFAMCAAFLSPELKQYGVGDTTVLFLFAALMGAAFGLMGVHSMLENAYTVGVFRLEGWRNGQYGVRLRLYSNGRLRPHSTKNQSPEIFWVGEGREDLPRAPLWRNPPAGLPRESVLLCGAIFTHQGPSS